MNSFRFTKYAEQEYLTVFKILKLNNDNVIDTTQFESKIIKKSFIHLDLGYILKGKVFNLLDFEDDVDNKSEPFKILKKELDRIEKFLKRNNKK